MSERGSFCTEYISCARCFTAVHTVLAGREKYLCGDGLPSWQPGETLPIIAGKIGGFYAGDELVTFERELLPYLADTICHPLRVAVLVEQGEQIFTIQPRSYPPVEKEVPCTCGHWYEQHAEPDYTDEDLDGITGPCQVVSCVTLHRCLNYTPA